jgi:hypothetical protein
MMYRQQAIVREESSVLLPMLNVSWSIPPPMYWTH